MNFDKVNKTQHPFLGFIKHIIFDLVIIRYSEQKGYDAHRVKNRPNSE